MMTGKERRNKKEHMIKEYIRIVMDTGRKAGVTGYRNQEEIEKYLIGINKEAVGAMNLEGEGADVGSGNGSLAVVVKWYYPEKRVYCVERNRRKAAFIRQAMHRLKIEGVEVIAADLHEIRGGHRWDWVILREVRLDEKLMVDIESCLNEEGRIYWITSMAKAEELRQKLGTETKILKVLQEGYCLVRR
ncbi:MAG: hypothetical protein A2Y62_12090 [Candidatus Fischerbacteria bacterium RBG_13_37_8]|uniref:16S rRNA m7G methyltransferase n=1 Tax=Candidatus Fischerbacteria bacterium RBG_13_37_8 TaxID=1817863 RepID=A0A1F5VDU7_9BACT|nr:MAG: hypothetical protein A2Y62_12090 [Candidatus Fischerbacteria bacterium RBG_13_37_8]